jgi:hypothetical protein
MNGTYILTQLLHTEIRTFFWVCNISHRVFPNTFTRHLSSKSHQGEKKKKKEQTRLCSCPPDFPSSLNGQFATAVHCCWTLQT